LTAELQTDFDYLTQARSTDGLPIRQASTIGIDRQTAVDFRSAFAKQLLLLAVLTNAALEAVTVGADTCCAISAGLKTSNEPW
jgi:hypothetical protein